MKNTSLRMLILGLVGTTLVAAPIEFDFKDPKGVNNVIFKTDAPLESINGTATGISGKVTFDPDNPGAIKGKIVVQSSSLHVDFAFDRARIVRIEGHFAGNAGRSA